ncbi:hypothetical protein LO762_01150 [Actinocorallia sp. API 0066]|uniref:hypothetical protein n=1 Tax=Actinocorallia sp. API 0066 TaxID=2896846 RepID=UPI001E5CA95E|nr:hypothetical protein [Actinocorallia sp. API 0066]MCD0447807.1 hypothetical protein [Actinocorallia sp. API 0066]
MTILTEPKGPVALELTKLADFALAGLGADRPDQIRDHVDNVTAFEGADNSSMMGGWT